MLIHGVLKREIQAGFSAPGFSARYRYRDRNRIRYSGNPAILDIDNDCDSDLSSRGSIVLIERLRPGEVSIRVPSFVQDTVSFSRDGFLRLLLRLGDE